MTKKKNFPKKFGKGIIYRHHRWLPKFVTSSDSGSPGKIYVYPFQLYVYKIFPFKTKIATAIKLPPRRKTHLPTGKKIE